MDQSVGQILKIGIKPTILTIFDLEMNHQHDVFQIQKCFTDPKGFSCNSY